MRVLCGGEDGVMGVYGGELLPDPHREAENRLVRIDAIYEYPHQRAIITHILMKRLPLPWGAVVRIRIIGPCEGAGAADEGEYERMIEDALRRRTAACRAEKDIEAYIELKKRKAGLTGISGSYCRR